MLDMKPQNYILGAIWICLVLTLFIGQASAWTSSEFTKDEIKSLDKLTNFGTYTIKESAWYDPLKIWTEETIKEVTLEDNTDTCGQNCKAQMRFNLLKDGVLIEDSKFLDVENGMKETTIRSSSIWIWDNPLEKTEKYIETECSGGYEDEEGYIDEVCIPVTKERSYYYKLVDDYQYTCKETGELTKNGTAILDCSNVLVGQKEYRYDGWVRYNIGDEVVAGEYLVEFRGNKPFDKEIDWQIKVDGQWTSAWAIWGTSDMTNGLVAQYRANTNPNYTLFNQTQVLDFTGINNGTLSGRSFNNGVVSGGVTIEDGAMKFDGVNGRVVGTAQNFIKNTAFSFSTWVYLDNATNKDSVIFSNHYNATEQWTIRYTNASGYFDGAFYRSDGGSIYEGRFGALATKGQWLYLTVVYNGSTLNQGTNGVKFYINGILQGVSGGNAGGALGSAGTFTIASRNDGNSYLNGSIDDTLIFNRALSQDEITQLYNQGRGQYSSVTNGLVAQYSGRDFAGSSASPTIIYDTNHLGDGKVLESLSFDGVNDIISIPLTPGLNFSGNDNLSITGWFKRSSLVGTKGIIGQGTEIIIRDIGSNNQIEFILNSFTTNDRVTAPVLSTYDWYFFSAFYNGSDMCISINNGINYCSSPTGSYGASSFDWAIGRSGSINNENFNGSIDDVRIYNRTLSEDEIAYLYNSGLGREDSSDAWIEVNSPANNSIQYTNSVTVNASAYVESGAYLTNASLNLSINGGAWEIKNTTDLTTISEDGLVSYYKLDETSGTTVTDSRGSNTGTNIGTATVNQAGKISTAYKFDGINDQVNLSKFNIDGDNTVSFNFWVKVHNFSVGNLLTNRRSATEFNGFLVNSTGGVAFTIYDGSFYGNNDYPNKTLSLDTWEMVTFTMDGTTWKMYIGGELSKVSTYNKPIIEKENWVIANDIFHNNYANITMDEVGFWNRTLNSTEIALLYNSGAGSRPGTTTTTTTTTTQTFTNTFNAGDVVDFNYEFCDTDGDCGKSETRRFTIDSTVPTITLNYPTSLIDYGKVNGTLQLNFTATDTNLDSVWYDYNGTNISIAGASSGVENLENITLSTKKNVTIYANDTAGNLYSEVFGWDYKVFERDMTFNSNVYETQTQTISTTMDYNSSLYALNVILNYNGTNYTTINNGSGNTGIFSRTFDTSIGTEAKDFFYYIFAGSTLLTQTSTKTQNISALILVPCNSTYNINAVNFTMVDEKTLNNINASANPLSFQAFFRYWIGTGSLQKNTTYQVLNSTTSSKFTFCIYPYEPNNYTFKVDLDSIFSAVGYSENEYYMRNLTLTNDTTDRNIPLYLLPEGQSTKFYVTVKRGIIYVPNVLVNIAKFFTGEGIYKATSRKVTDVDGRFPFYADLDGKYLWTVLNSDGTVLGSIEKVATCGTAPCSLELNLDEDVENIFESIEDYYASNIVSSLTFNPETKVVTYNFVDTTGTAQYFRLQVQKTSINETAGTIICDETAFTVSGILTCNVTGFEGDFFATGFISRSPEKVDKIISFFISDAFTGMGLMGIFLNIIIIVTVIFISAGISRGNPAVICFMAGITILLLKLGELFPFSWTVVVALEVALGYLLTKVDS